MRLYIIRHAQSANNALYASTGSGDGRSPDPVLTELGHRQAARLARFLTRSQPEVETDRWDAADRAGFGVTHIYTSLMQRAILTATVVAQALDLPLVAWPDIHEQGGIFMHDPVEDQNHGLPGPNRAFFEAEYPHLTLPDYLGDGGWWNRPFESRAECYDRAGRVAGELLERHGQSDDRIVLVTHGAFSHRLLSTLLDRPQPQEEASQPPYLWLLMNNAAITRLDYNDPYGTLVYTNRLEHLPLELITD